MPLDAATLDGRPAAGDPRNVEGWALLEAARRLDEARKGGSGEAILRATEVNWRLWTLFQANLGDPRCGLPDAIRRNMLALANFIDRRSADIIAAPNAGKLDALIRIDLEIGGGLMGESSSLPDVARIAG
jgi:flagellar protein FlaF